MVTSALGQNHISLEKVKFDCLLESLKMKLKLKRFKHKMQRLESLEKTLILREIEDY